jgi:hypothetical protein
MTCLYVFINRKRLIFQLLKPFISLDWDTVGVGLQFRIICETGR